MSRMDAMPARRGRFGTIMAWAGALLVVAAIGWAAEQTFAQAPIRRAPQSAPAGANASRPTAPQASVGPARDIVAEVNNERVTRLELGRECLTRHGQAVLETIVNRQLIFQACQQRNISISDEDIDSEIASIAKRFRMDVNTWLAMLKKEREISETQYRQEIIWSTLALQKLAKSQLVVTDEEIKRAIEAEFGPKVRARIISVSSRDKAEQLHAKAAADPKGFADLAKKHSEDANSASAGGLIPPIRLHVGDPKVEEIAFALTDGEVSDIIYVANQYIIIKCDKQVPQTFLTPEQLDAARERASVQLRDQRLRTEASEIFQELEKSAEIVKVFGDPALEQKHPGVAAFINRQAYTLDQLAEACIARYGEEVLDIMINRRLLAQALHRGGKQVAREEIDAEIARAADAYGYLKTDGTPDVQKWLNTVSEGDQSQVDVYVSDAVWPSAALKKLVTEKIEVTKDDLEKGYQANFGERVQVLAIMLGNRRDAQKVWEMARNNPTDDFFGELASQYSIEPVSKANFGRVPPIRRHSGQDNLETEAFRLKPGELSELIVVGSNYVVLRCLGRTQPMVRPDEVKEELYKDLYEKKLRLAMDSTFERLKESSRIRNFIVDTKRTASRTVVPASAIQPAPRGAAAPRGPATPRSR